MRSQALTEAEAHRLPRTTSPVLWRPRSLELMEDLVHFPQTLGVSVSPNSAGSSGGEERGLQKPGVQLQGSPTHLCTPRSAPVVPSPVLSAGSRGSGGLSGLFALVAVAKAYVSGDQRERRRGRGRQEESGQPRAAAVSLPIPVGLRLRTRCGHRGRMSQAGVRAP